MVLLSEASSLIAGRGDGKSFRPRAMTSRSPGLTIAALVCAFAFVGIITNTIERSGQHEPVVGMVNRVPIVGKSKSSKGSKSGNSLKDEEYDCGSDIKYSKRTMKTAYELPFAALFKDNKGQKKFEASDVTIVGDNVYSVCDSSFAISKFDDSLSPFSDANKQIGSPERDGDVESGYEAIFHHNGLFYVVRESVLHHHHDDDEVEEEDEDAVKAGKKHSFHAIIEEIVLGEDDYTVQNECRCEFEFEGSSKGFEGAVGFPDASGELYILGLCEGNHCSEERKADAGHGRMVLMKKSTVPNPNIPGELSCIWETVRMIHIPKSVQFIDYSAIDITDDGRVAITSQENSALWIGAAVGISNGIIDPEAFEFNEESGDTFQFPKSDDCHTIYCNIEGIHWMNNEMLMGVSDKMKGEIIMLIFLCVHMHHLTVARFFAIFSQGKGKQDYRCFEKDQSIHAFVLP